MAEEVLRAQRKIPVDLHFIVRLRHKASGAALGLSCAVCFVQPAGGGGVSGGSLRSSRQAVTCHPFTRSWATMPPEAPPPPGFSEEFVFVIHMLYICDIIYNEKDYEYGSS